MAKRKRKKITREMVRAVFGDDAQIGWFYPWRVKTLTGGEVVISQRNIQTITGTEDTHRAVMLLVAECWGKCVSYGSPEFVLAQVMHGEAAGVPIRADYRNKNGGGLPVAVFVVILFVGWAMGAANNPGALVLTVIVAFVVAAAMSQSEKQKARKKHEQMSFPYPRVYGSAGPARREDLKRRGWL
ncbi:MAG: hypothetical protein ACRD3O_00025 [Terriglobia bacterium]